MPNSAAAGAIGPERLGGVRTESLRIAGEKVAGDRHFEVRYPYTGEVVAVVPNASVAEVRRAIDLGAKFRSSLTRHDRYRILMKAGEIIAQRRDEIARLITLESGLCLKTRCTKWAVPATCCCFQQIKRWWTTARFSRVTSPRTDATQGLHDARAAARRDHRDHAI